eukprot:scaffold932_cov328-Pavlova_lutheri.AAC.9
MTSNGTRVRTFDRPSRRAPTPPTGRPAGRSPLDPVASDQSPIGGSAGRIRPGSAFGGISAPMALVAGTAGFGGCGWMPQPPTQHTAPFQTERHKHSED